LFEAEIYLDRSSPWGKLDRDIYGQFVEHLGRVVYGGYGLARVPQSPTSGDSAKTCWRRWGRSTPRKPVGPGATLPPLTTGWTAWGQGRKGPRISRWPGTPLRRTSSFNSLC